MPPPDCSISIEILSNQVCKNGKYLGQNSKYVHQKSDHLPIISMRHHNRSPHYFRQQMNLPLRFN